MPNKAQSGFSLSKLSMPTVLVAFLPVLLTRFLFRVSILIGKPLSGSIRAYPLGGFIVYVACVWLVVGVGWAYLHRKGATWRDLGFTNFCLRDMAWAVLAALFGLFVVFPMSQGLARWLRLPVIQGIRYHLESPADLLIAISICTLIGPLGEEILYRGFLLGLLWAKLGRAWLAGLLTTLIFALVHIPGFGLAGALFILLWTPLVVILFVWRRSIYLPYVVHVLNNTFAYVLVPLLWL
jgi:membrane protease YdiL (CAAX protease family)